MTNVTLMSDRELIEAYQTSTESSKNLYASELLQRHDRLIRRYSRLMRDRYEQYSDLMEWEDLYQECRIGYVYAIGQYRLDLNKSFNTVAYLWMRQKARRYFEKYGRNIKHGFHEIDTKIARIKADYENIGLEVPADAYDHIFKSKKKQDEYWRFVSTTAAKGISLDEIIEDDYYGSVFEGSEPNPERSAVINDAIDPITFVLTTFTYNDAKTIASSANINLSQLGLTREDFPKRVSYPKIKGQNRLNELKDEFRQRLRLTNYTKNDLMEVFAS